MENPTIAQRKMVVERKLNAEPTLPVKRRHANYVEAAHSPYDFTPRLL